MTTDPRIEAAEHAAQNITEYEIGLDEELYTADWDPLDHAGNLRRIVSASLAAADAVDPLRNPAPEAIESAARKLQQRIPGLIPAEAMDHVRHVLIEFRGGAE